MGEARQYHKDTNTQQHKGKKMTEQKKTKTIGLDVSVWRELKMYALENDCTLSEAVDELLKLASEVEDTEEKEKD